MKKTLSIMLALLLGCLCVLGGASAENGALREIPEWAGYYSFNVLRGDFSDLFWAAVQEESPYARASLTESDWQEIENLEGLSIQTGIVPEGYRLYQKVFTLSDGQEAFVFSAFTDAQDYITSLTYSAPNTSTIRSWAFDENAVSSLTITYYLIYPGACFSVLAGQALGDCVTKVNTLISDAADGTLPVDGNGEYYVTEGLVQYSITSGDDHIPHFRFCALAGEAMPDVTVEPEPEITPEPTAEPAPDITPEPTEEPVPEPTEEPTPEPVPDITPEPTAEPAPEPTAAPSAEDLKILYVAKTNKSANIRDIPDKNGNLVGRIPGKMWTTYILDIVDGEDGKTWYKVMSLDGYIGYVRKDFFHQLEPYEGN